ncbi:MAG: TolC family protein [Bacteroidales bacterium]|nr:TolC family protein [Bacteroidales bacterium]MBN2698031.1 TolC family protein [Bacteroidales bacterium]
MKINKLYSIVLVLSIILGSQTVRAQDILDEYLTMAAENSPLLKARFNDYLAALETVPQVGALPDPQLAFGYFIQPIQTGVGPQEFRISATQMFPWFGTLNARENVAIQSAKAKYELFEESKAKLFDKVRGTYYSLYFNQKAVSILIENIEILQRFQKLALIKVETGKVSAVDEFRIEMEMGDLENQLALLRDNRQYLLVAFNNLLNTELAGVSFPDTLWDTASDLSRQAILDSIRMGNHQLLGLELQREALNYKQEVAKKSGKPDFSLGLDYIVVGRGENNLSGQDAFMFPRIGITIPLYRNKYRSMIKEAAYKETAKAFEKKNKMNMLETLFEKSWNELQDAERRIVLYHQQQDLANRSINLLEVEYATADKNFEEVLRMERKQLFYSLELERARVDKQAAVSFLNYLMGK